MSYLTAKLLGVALAASISFTTPSFAHDDDASTIKHLMMATFDKPEAPLMVEPVTVVSDVAVAGWTQGEMGGRALLRKHGGKWMLTLCSGDALKEAKSLQQFSLISEQANSMAKAIVEAEATVDPALVAKFSSFDGVVMMNGDALHSPVENQGSQHQS